MKRNLNQSKFYIFIFSILLAFSCTQQPKPFNLVLLPDTQVYSRMYPEIFRVQTEWVVQNADSIAFVLHQGDITDHNSDEQWQNAAAALSVMDGKVPYTFVPGNHDLGPGGSASNRDAELLNQYLPYDRYSGMDHFGGAFEAGSMENTYHTFRAGGFDWLILSLEFGTRNKILRWDK